MKIYIVIGKFGSGKYTWIENNIKKRKKEFSVINADRECVAEINCCIYFSETANRDVYIIATNIEQITNDIIKKADVIKNFESEEK